MDDIDKKLVQAVVLLNRQGLLTDHLIATQSPLLQGFERAISEKKQTLNHVLDVYNYVFGLIDHLVRYQKIAMVLPRHKQASAEYRALNLAMGDLKDIRNQLQHLNNDIDNDYTGPLLGAVCWPSGKRQFMASFEDIGRERTSPGLAFNPYTGTHAQGFCYVYNEIYHDLDKAIEGMRAFDKYISSNVSLVINGEPYDPNKHFIAACFRIELTPKSPPKA